MVNSILQYIEPQLKAYMQFLNRVDSPVFRISNGEMIKGNGQEKEVVTISDLNGNSLYIRQTQPETINERKALSSCDKEYNISARCKVVFYTFGGNDFTINPDKVKSKIVNTLARLDFSHYTGTSSEIKIDVNGTSLDIEKIYTEETGKEFTGNVWPTLVSVDFTLSYVDTNCNTCDIEDNDNPVSWSPEISPDNCETKAICDVIAKCDVITTLQEETASLQEQIDNLPPPVSNQSLQDVINVGSTVNGVVASSLSNLSTIRVTDQWGEIRYFDGIVKGLVQPSYIQTLLSWATAVASGFVKINEFKTKVTHTALNEFDAPLHTFNNSVTKNGLEVATENYVNNLIAGLKFKLDVVAASIANVNISSAPSTLDGVTLTSGDRVLLKNQTTQSENGCYDFNGTGNALTRSDDSDSGVKLVSATYPVSGGATNQDTWFTVTNDSITLGSTNIVITQTAGSGTYTVGSYLKLIGNVFDIDFTTFSTTQITEGTKLFFTDARVLTAPLTGFASAAGTITAADTILSAINKLNGNVALKAATTYVDDLKANFINKKNSDTPHTGTTSPTVIHSFEITPGTCQANDVLKFYIRHYSTNNANSKAVKIWANSSNTIVGATQLSNYAYTTNSGGVLSFKRSLIFKNSLTSQKIINTTVSHANDDVSYLNNGDSTLSLNFNNSVFIFIEVTLANAADIFTMNLFNCKIER